MFKYFNNVWHIKSQKARPSHLLGPRAEGFALYLVSVHDSHCLHHSGISTYFDKDSSVCHFFPSNNFFRSYMLHIWFKGLFVWKPSTPLTFSCHVRSFTFIFISFLTPEIYLCIWKNTWQIILSARFVGVLRWPPPRRNKLGPRDSMSP